MTDTSKRTINSKPIKQVIHELAQTFPQSDMTRDTYNGFDYVSGEKIKGRLIQVLGLNFSISEPKLVYTNTRILPVKNKKKGADEPAYISKEYTTFMVTTVITVYDDDGQEVCHRSGIAGDDKPCALDDNNSASSGAKSAFTGAIKIAATGLSIALHLYFKSGTFSPEGSFVAGEVRDILTGYVNESEVDKHEFYSAEKLSEFGDRPVSSFSEAFTGPSGDILARLYVEWYKSKN